MAVQTTKTIASEMIADILNPHCSSKFGPHTDAQASAMSSEVNQRVSVMFGVGNDMLGKRTFAVSRITLSVTGPRPVMFHLKTPGFAAPVQLSVSLGG